MKECDAEALEATYRIAGAAPPGIKNLAGELGWLTKRMNIKMSTSMGKKMTIPNGTEMVEFPRNRKGLRKNAMRESLFFPLFSSTGSGRGGSLETPLVARRIKSMARMDLPQRQVL